uniref:Uncharacterized protein n=1 Tax=Lepeophtheirus salmonis TaxID=72036 RepID=A0A0K2V433_LEPSM
MLEHSYAKTQGHQIRKILLITKPKIIKFLHTYLLKLYQFSSGK